MEGYLQTPADHIKVNPYLDLDKLIVDGDVPPIYMITSVEDFIADNTYELARILHARHKDHAMSVWPKGRERVLGHVDVYKRQRFPRAAGGVGAAAPFAHHRVAAPIEMFAVQLPQLLSLIHI